jgi:hypothetical protein
MKHVVKQGECMASIGALYGFHWKTLWDLADNATLKAKRKNPYVLFAGDEVTIPDKRVKQEAKPTNGKYRFVRKGVPEKLRLKLLDANRQPRANLDYLLVIDGKSSRGKTDSQGELAEAIAPGAKDGKIVLGADQQEVIGLQLGQLDPASEVSGVQGRLANLGFYKGPIDGNLDAATSSAIRIFQAMQGLPVTGAADDATGAQLEKLHGH